MMVGNSIFGILSVLLCVSSTVYLFYVLVKLVHKSYFSKKQPSFSLFYVVKGFLAYIISNLLFLITFRFDKSGVISQWNILYPLFYSLFQFYGISQFILYSMRNIYLEGKRQKIIIISMTHLPLLAFVIIPFFVDQNQLVSRVIYESRNIEYFIYNFLCITCSHKASVLMFVLFLYTLVLLFEFYIKCICTSFKVSKKVFYNIFMIVLAMLVIRFFQHIVVSLAYRDIIFTNFSMFIFLATQIVDCLFVRSFKEKIIKQNLTVDVKLTNITTQEI